LFGTAGEEGLVDDENEGDENIQAAYPLKDLFGIRREKVARARVGIKDEKKCGERHEPNGKLLPHRERARDKKQNKKHDCERSHAVE